MSGLERTRQTVEQVERLVRQRQWACETLETCLDLLGRALSELAVYDPQAARDIATCASERIDSSGETLARM